MIYLDTHVVLWLYEGLIENFNKKTKDLMSNNPIFISPMVMLELQYLYEINRSLVKSQDIYEELNQSIGLEICTESFASVLNKALALSWTRDPFDRLIVANAMIRHRKLVTKDHLMLKHYKLSVW